MNVLCHVLSLGVDVAAWWLDRFADVAAPTGQRLTAAADTARWLASGSRVTP